jgi:dihydroneopterin aldolase
MFFFCRKKTLSPINRIFIKDMVVEMGIGVYAEEKGRKQRVRINIEVEPSVWPNAAHDNLDETVSYDLLKQIVEKHAAGGHVHLVETLAERIAQDVLNHNALETVTVRVEKLDIYQNAVPGVEIVRVKS